MTRYIAHRGNISGPNEEMENNPAYIKLAMQMGYDVEIDVWKITDGLYLGHDKPTYKIDRYFLQNRKIWAHCKNMDALNELSKYININCFWQTDEMAVFTSDGRIWQHSKSETIYPGVIITKLDSRNWEPPSEIFGLCSDYVSQFTPTNILPFDLLIIDIDGVMTDSTKMYDRDAKVFGKTYSDLDFTAIKRFKSAGINVCFFSGDETVNKAMAESRKIDFFHNIHGTDKADQLSAIKTLFNSKTTAYVGDDYYDLGIMNNVDLAFCPRTSFKAVKRSATSVIDVDAGKGVIAGLYDMFEDIIDYVFPVDAANVNPK